MEPFHLSFDNHPQVKVENILLQLSFNIARRVKEKIGDVIHPFSAPPKPNATRNELSEYIQQLFDILISLLGPTVARKTFETELIGLKEIYGSTEAYSELLRILPVPVLEAERLSLLNKQELETELLYKIKELEAIKTDLERKISDRTTLLTLEKNKLSLILSGVNDAIIALDLNRNIVIFSKAAQILTGLKVEQVLGRPVGTILKVYSGNDEISDLIYGQTKMGTYEGLIFEKKGLKIVIFNNHVFYANLSSSQIKEGGSFNVGTIITMHDVTEERQLEEMKLDFVSMAAHELRTPLTSIRGYLSVFMNENDKVFTGEQRLFLDRISISAQQLQALVENLLNVSRIERGAFSIMLEPLDWVPFVSQIVSEFTQRARERRIDLEFVEPAEPIGKVLADKLRISEVVSNLLSNAIAYTKPGGSVKVFIEKSGGEIITSVEDTGIGIPKESLAHLFTKFFRVSARLAQGSKGTGLGLYISKAMVDMHHGRIWVESELDKGSRFSFSLHSYKDNKNILTGVVQ